MDLVRNPQFEEKLRLLAVARGHELDQSFRPAKGNFLLEAKCLYCGAWGLYSPDSGVVTGGVVGSPVLGIQPLKEQGET